ncbi:EF hand and Peptidase S54 domain containing protein [Aphelenchoides besseyi]|nr:EF hand and Peptidase S54 domain containing protein [Aphelenchoides besseyi]
MTTTLQKLEMEQNQDDWHALFRQLDVDNDGLLDLNTLKAAVNDSASSMGLSREEAGYLLLNVDQNDDSHVDFGEFCSLMAKVKQLHLTRLMLYAARSVVHKKAQGETCRYILQYNCLPPPLFMLAISIVQIAVYLYYTFEFGGKFSAIGPVPVHSIFILDPHHKAQIWRFFTYMFIHVGYTHLITNVFVQLLLGLPLELVHKLWRLGALYILSVFTGAILVMAVDPNVYLGGASGGAYGLLSAHVSNLIINWNEMEWHWIRALVLFVLIFTDVGVAVYQRYFAAVLNRISYVSHIGGFIAGLLLGVVLLRNVRWKRYETYLWWSCLVAYILFATVCIIVIYAPALF